MKDLRDLHDLTIPDPCLADACGVAQDFFFVTLVTGPRRSLSLKLSDTRVYAPQIRALLGTDSHFCEVVVLKLRTGAGHSHWVTCVDMDPASSIVYSGGMDRVVKAWDMVRRPLLSPCDCCLNRTEGHGGEYGTYKTVEARFWPCLSGKRPFNRLIFSLHVRQR